MSNDELRFDDDGYLDLASFTSATDGAEIGSDDLTVDSTVDSTVDGDGGGHGDGLAEVLAADREDLETTFDESWLTDSLDAALDPDATYTMELDDDDWLPSTDTPEETTVSGPFDLSDYADVLTDDGETTGDDIADGDGADVDGLSDGLFDGAFDERGFVEGALVDTDDTTGSIDDGLDDGTVDGDGLDDGFLVVEEIPWDDPLDDLSGGVDLGASDGAPTYGDDGPGDDLSDLEF